MKQKIFFTSIISMLVVMPAMAKPSHTGEFPSTGLMQEDYTYTNAATFENTGVYDGSVDAIAEFEYHIGAGEYLPAGADEIVDCPAGSFCPGIDGNVQYNQSSAQGIQTCPTGYASSAAGASSDTQCYRACDINNMGANGSIANIAHATAISGNDYYGSGTDTCEPTACVNGWHLKQGLNLATAIGTGEGENSAYIGNAGTFIQETFGGGTDHDQAFYGLSNNNTWAVYYDSTHGMLTGQGRCSTQSGSRGTLSNGTYPDITTFASLADETGQEGAYFCYCNVTGYTPNGGTLQAVSSPWVFNFNFNSGDASSCAGYCVYACAALMRYAGSTINLAFRAALLGAVQSSPAMCEANVININWNGTTQEAINANNAGTATYGSDVRTPVSATPVKGKTFRGWRFSAPEQVSTGD